MHFLAALAEGSSEGEAWVELVGKLNNLWVAPKPKNCTDTVGAVIAGHNRRWING